MLRDGNCYPIMVNNNYPSQQTRKPTEEEKTAKKAYREEQKRRKQKRMENIRKAQEKARIKDIVEDGIAFIFAFGFLLLICAMLNNYF